MITEKLKGVRFVVANTDAQALERVSDVDAKLQLGTALTKGLGAGARPDVGRSAAEESLPEVLDALKDTSILFVTAGMGGGTGTGASPVIAEAARKANMLVVGVVSTPFEFEGKKRRAIADEGLRQLEAAVDTLVVVPNQNLLSSDSSRLTLIDAFKRADDVLYQGVRGITDLITVPGLVNVDFADIRSIMLNGGRAHMAIGEASGPGRAEQACTKALCNPLIADDDLHGATGAIINITGNTDLTLVEVDEIARRVQSHLSPDANIIFGSTRDSELVNSVRVTLIVTGVVVKKQHTQPTSPPPPPPVQAQLRSVSHQPQAAAPTQPDAQPQQPHPQPFQAPATPSPSLFESLKNFLSRHW